MHESGRTPGNIPQAFTQRSNVRVVVEQLVPLDGEPLTWILASVKTEPFALLDPTRDLLKGCCSRHWRRQGDSQLPESWVLRPQFHVFGEFLSHQVYLATAD